MKPYYFVFSVFVLCLISCDKDSDILAPDPFYPDQPTFRSSLFVQVVNAAGYPVAKTLIRIGNLKRETDIKGFIYLEDVLVGATTYLTAEKDGYFHASRRFYPTEGSSQYIKLIMLSDQQDDTFSAGTGDVITVDGGVTLHFPKDGYESLNGDDYNGMVVVSAKVIPADDPDLSYKMPGDLTGVDANGVSGSLASMGMVAVEMKSSSGNILRLKEGIQVQIDMTVPSSHLTNAPPTIPMWYFNEEEGIWKEEGSASLSGNIYTANVSHFSYWNCDVRFPAIKWGATFDFGNRGLASQVEVCITIISLNTTKCAYTNAEGMVCGLVAANELLLMEVTSACGEIIYSDEIGPFSDSIMLGPITLSDPGILVTTVSGHAITCDGDPVTHGYASISLGGVAQYAELDASGAFTIAINSCEEGEVLVGLWDVGRGAFSPPLSFLYAPVIDTDTITVCETTDEFIDIEVVGIPEHYYFLFPELDLGEDSTFIYADDGFSQGSQIFVGFQGQTTGIRDNYWNWLYVHLPGEGTFYVGDSTLLNLNITHYGNVGDYVKGTLTGTCTREGSGTGGSEEYPVVVSFAVLREE